MTHEKRDRRVLTIMLALTCASVIACAGKPNNNFSVQPAPLEGPSSQRLEALLLGDWRFAGSKSSLSSKSSNPRQSQMAWSLDDSGRFVFQQSGSFSGVVVGKWWLDGRNLHMRSEGNGALDAFRVEEWSSGRMLWYSYREQSYLVVERAGLIQAGYRGRP